MKTERRETWVAWAGGRFAQRDITRATPAHQCGSQWLLGGYLTHPAQLFLPDRRSETIGR